MISVVMRTKNEAVWIQRSLTAVLSQDYIALEVIVVDNDSLDETRELATQFDCRLLQISDANYSHGRALNLGIQAARGEYVAILSSHCIPVNDKWLFNLARNMADTRVAGVYGRQEPLPDTKDVDKRDLWTTFGLDRRVQTRDYFFHNANSLIRRSIWETIPFNEQIDGVEDRDWAKKVLSMDYQIIYEPTASVFHYHGIHHGQDETRAARVARVIELINT